MARYRKVDTRIWNDAKFNALSDDGKLVFFLLLTHPQMTALGAMRATIPGLAEELGWLPEAFREAFQEALAKGMAKHDPEARLIVLPNFLKYNRPESPNVVKAWDSALDLLPECRLKSELIQDVKAFAEGLTEGFAKALPEAFAKGMPYQEQEQEQEQEQDKSKHTPASPEGEPGLPGIPPADSPESPSTKQAKGKRAKPKRPIPEDFTVTPDMVAWANENGFGHVNLLECTDEFVDYWKARGDAYADWVATWRNRIRQIAKRTSSGAPSGPLSAVDRVRIATGQ
ncbi:MAG: hypothetical protein AAGI72_15375 [Pseudomonadota bacterium]